MTDQSYIPDKSRVPCGAAVWIPLVTADTGFRETNFMDDHYLFIMRRGSHGENTWSIPGGWVSESDASVEAAAVREVWEEVGLTITIDSIKFCGFTMDHHKEGLKGITMYFKYIGGFPGTARNTNPARISQIDFFDIDEMKQRPKTEVFTPLLNYFARYRTP